MRGHSEDEEGYGLVPGVARGAGDEAEGEGRGEDISVGDEEVQELCGC